MLLFRFSDLIYNFIQLQVHCDQLLLRHYVALFTYKSYASPVIYRLTILTRYHTDNKKAVIRLYVPTSGGSMSAVSRSTMKQRVGYRQKLISKELRNKFKQS